MNIIVTILVSILVFGLIIFIHELGHFLCAKAFHVTVDEFALGMGPTLLKKRLGGTTYALRLFPIGGFVKMQGEERTEDGARSDDPGMFYNKPCWQRIIILAAGAFMNLLLGLILSLTMTLTQTHIATNIVARFEENASSAESGLALEDEILKINGVSILTDRDIVTQLLSDEDGSYQFIVRRNGEKVTLNGVKLASRETESGEKSLILDFKVYSYPKTFLTTVKYTWNNFLSLARSIWLSLGDLISGKVGFSQLSGPVGVSKVIGQAASAGFETFFYIVAFITINIGIFNLLPIPALDGGRLIFVLIELIIRKPVPGKYENMIHFIGLMLLLLLMLAVTAKDIIGLFR